MKLLWISTRWPFPADDGAKRASASLLLALAELGHEVDILTFAREATLPVAPHPHLRLLRHHRGPTLAAIPRFWAACRNLAGQLPVSAAPFARFGLSWEGLAGLTPAPPAAVVFDGPHGYAAFGGKPCPWPVLYRAHNVEAALWEQAAERSWPRAYFTRQAKRMRAFEASLGEGCRGVAAISPEDAAVFRSWWLGVPVEWVPIGFEGARALPPPPGPFTLGFLGRMDWPPNQDGLRWFLTKVWPAARRRRPDLRLRIAGSGDGRWLASYRWPGIEWLGRVETVESFYESVHAVIVPIRFGSGTKIKLVEAACHGRASFVTPAALLGSGLPASVQALVAEGAEAWIESIVGANGESLSRLGTAALTEASGLFSPSAAAARFLSLLPPVKD